MHLQHLDRLVKALRVLISGVLINSYTDTNRQGK